MCNCPNPCERGCNQTPEKKDTCCGSDAVASGLVGAAIGAAVGGPVGAVLGFVFGAGAGQSSCETKQK